MKKMITLLALSAVSSLLADCAGGQCSGSGYYNNNNAGYYNNGNYAGQNGYQNGYQGGNQGAYQGDYQNDGQNAYQGHSYRNDSYQRNQNSQGYDRSHYEARPASYDNKSSNYDNKSSNYDNRNDYDNRYNASYNNRQDAPAKGSDQEISEKLHNMFASGWMSNGYPNVSYDVQNGNVTLKGSVETLSDKEKIKKDATALNGVKQVNDQIVVAGKPTASNDGSYYADNASKVKNTENKFPQDVATTGSDRVLNNKIREKLNGWFVNDFDSLTLKTNNGVVTIMGIVEKPSDIQNLNEKLKDMSEIVSINNQVTARNNK